MAVWSCLVSKNADKNINIARRVIASLKNGNKGKVMNYVPVRNSSHRELVIRNSTFFMYKFKDMCYLYLTIGALPLLAIALYCNIFIGPATLAVIPEGYTPKPWEYYRHPITRFLARYIIPSPQEAYERSLHSVFFANEITLMRKLERKTKELVRERKDYQAWYFEKPISKYVRKARKESEEHERGSGLYTGWIH